MLIPCVLDFLITRPAAKRTQKVYWAAGAFTWWQRFFLQNRRMPRWNRTSRWKRNRIKRIAQRDGSCCWLCNREIKLDAVANTRKAPTIEHLKARSLGGGDALENLALCHPACNRHLKDRPLEAKQKMREKHHLETAKVLKRVAAAKKKSSPATAPA